MTKLPAERHRIEEARCAGAAGRPGTCPFDLTPFWSIRCLNERSAQFAGIWFICGLSLMIPKSMVTNSAWTRVIWCGFSVIPTIFSGFSRP
jgi:hypothetical protein